MSRAIRPNWSRRQRRDAAQTPPPPRVPEEVAEAARGLDDGKPTREQLVDHLVQALEADLQAPKGGFFTQVVCARAAQYEILRQELGKERTSLLCCVF